jgi:hypothetical protein
MGKKDLLDSATDPTHRMGIPMNVYQRLHEAMAKVTYVQKEKKSGMNYSITSHDDVTAKVRPALHAVGVIYHPCNLVFTQNGNRTEVQMDVKFVNIDDPDTDYFIVPSLGYGIDAQDKGPGKAISYAVKYALLKALGLETGDDPDMDQKTEHKEDPAAKPVQQKSAKLAPPNWNDWVKKTTEEIAMLETEKARGNYIATIKASFELCQKEDAPLSEIVRTALAEKKKQIAEKNR